MSDDDFFLELDLLYGLDTDEEKPAGTGATAEPIRLAPQKPGDKPALTFDPEEGVLRSAEDRERIVRLLPEIAAWMAEIAKKTAAEAKAKAEAEAEAAAKAAAEASAAPKPYNYKYDVTDAETQLHHGKEETGNEAGRVEGSYYVLLPDNRLMTVSYYVDGESGFVPQISFQENANPF
ncbi:chitin-binding domain-containing protein [Streptomyces sp. BI20]|uniref:chitin-binding domain-containing protein n=1 Tax=Streptomyces sp. BI20 TaxID=3403460 RepID=UPI003C776ED1